MNMDRVGGEKDREKISSMMFNLQYAIDADRKLLFSFLMKYHNYCVILNSHREERFHQMLDFREGHIQD